ncbi:unnamed protein product [Staurois parvus]|uniref:Uncharacterized protein n=1 Tax=Staurois parvus TaxID=386267 RepID=A0ABN9D265_9NEOB|nr:unnamed protein product [Staurois parvus]
MPVPISATFQCPSVPHQCLLISAHQCHLSVPISAASLAHISEGEKSLIYKTFITKTKNKRFFFSKFSVVFGLFKKK